MTTGTTREHVATALAATPSRPAGGLRRALLPALLVLALTALLVLAVTAGPSSAATRPTAPAAHQAHRSLDEIRAMDPATYSAKVLAIINAKREAHGLKVLRLNACTDKLAETWGSYLASTLQFFHQDLTPFFDQCKAKYAGETLARGAVTPKQMVKLWMNSEEHRHILLSKYPNHIGLGATLDSRGDWLVAADFTWL